MITVTSVKYLSKYQKRSVASIIEKARALLNDKEMQEAYERLSSIRMVVLGDRIGGTAINSSVNNECGCERFNVRIIIVNEKDKEYIRNLINKINPKIAEGIVYLDIAEVMKLEGKRTKSP